MPDNQNDEPRRLSDIQNGKIFEIVELKGWYKLSHVARKVFAYDQWSHNVWVVNGLYESLEAGRWTIKWLRVKSESPKRKGTRNTSKKN